MCATNGWINEYHVNKFPFYNFFFYWKICTLRVIWWKIDKVLIIRYLIKSRITRLGLLHNVQYAEMFSSYKVVSN